MRSFTAKSQRDGPKHRWQSLADATANFAQKRDALWRHYQYIAAELKKAKPGASPPTGRTKTLPIHFVRLVADAKTITFQGRETTWEDLPELLKKTPDRGATVLEIARASSNLTVDQWGRAQGNAGNLAQELGFEYLSYIGVHPLGSKGSPSQTVPKKRPRTTTNEPITCLFKTREGTLGVLQLVGTDDAKTAKVRYQLVQGTKATDASPTSAR